MNGVTKKSADIYISGVSDEFKEHKEALATLLESMGHRVFQQTSFLPVGGSLLEKLETLIREECDACIFLVGDLYGGEPGQDDSYPAAQAGEKYSYAQWEYRFATQYQVPNFVFFSAPNTINSEPEEAPLPDLQQKFFDEIMEEKGQDCLIFKSLEDLLNQVRGLNFAPRDRLDKWEDDELGATVLESAEAPPSEAFPAAEGAAEAPPSADYPPEQVQFTAYRPKQLVAASWTPFLVFAHLEDRPPGSPADALSPIEEVRRQAEKVLGETAEDYVDKTKDSRYSIPREAEITLRPEVPGVRFNPPVRSFFWAAGVDVHREEFSILAEPDTVGRVLTGRLSIFLGSLILADIRLDFPVVSQAGSRPVLPDLTSSPATPYRRVFPSYSRLDLPVVEQIEQYSKTLGDSYLRDLVTLRPGEQWNSRLMELIAQADVFQLFWSSNSARSPIVTQEWQYASKLGRPYFIRPTYWEEKIPTPPEELASLHFQKLSIRPYPESAREVLKPRAGVIEEKIPTFTAPETKTAAVSLKKEAAPQTETAAVSVKMESPPVKKDAEVRDFGVTTAMPAKPPAPKRAPAPSPPGGSAGAPVFRPSAEPEMAKGRPQRGISLLAGGLALITLLILVIYFLTR